MKVLLISTNRLGYPSYVLPVGISSVGSYLEKQGYKTEMLDLCFVPEKDIEKAMEEKIIRCCPDVIGIGIRNYCTFMDDPPQFFLPFIKKVVDVCKKCSSAKIVLGGGGFSNDPEKILKYTDVDVGIWGEGEKAFEQYIACIEKDNSVKDVGGLVYKEKNEFKKNSMLYEKNLNKYPNVDRKYYDKRYYNVRSELGLRTTEAISLTRGCPFKCIYCSSAQFYSPEFRVKEIDKVIMELRELKERNINEFHIIDFAMNFPVGNAIEFLKRLKKEKLSFTWSGNIHPYPADTLPEAFFSLAKETGCEHLDFDTITCSGVMGKRLKRPGFSKESIKRSSELCHKYDVKFSHYLLIGGPGENISTLTETLKTVEETRPTANPAVVSNVGMVICSNTELSKIAKEENIIKSLDDLIFPPQFYLSNDLKDDAFELIKNYMKKHPKWLFVGMSLEKKLKKDDRKQELIPGTVLPSTQINAGDSFSKSVLPDMNNILVEIDPLQGKTNVLLIDSRESGQKAGPWIHFMIKGCKSNKKVVVNCISLVESLRFFVSKEFVLEHIREQSRGINRLIDWEGKLGCLLGITDVSVPYYVQIAEDGKVDRIASLPEFSPQQANELFGSILSN